MGEKVLFQLLAKLQGGLAVTGIGAGIFYLLFKTLLDHWKPLVKQKELRPQVVSVTGWALALIFGFCALLAILGFFAQRPTPTIQGTVVDESNSPVDQATVIIEGVSERGITTNGSFTMSIPEKAIQTTYTVHAQKGDRAGMASTDGRTQVKVTITKSPRQGANSPPGSKARGPKGSKVLESKMPQSEVPEVPVDPQADTLFGSNLSGRVSDEQGKALTSITVNCGSVSAVTDNQGLFSCSLPPHTRLPYVRIEIHAPGYVAFHGPLPADGIVRLRRN